MKNRLFTNSQIRLIPSEKIESVDDLILLFESISDKACKILVQHFEYQRQREDGICEHVYRKIDTIASTVKCNEKTVDRFNRDFHCVVQKRNRFIKGRQTSNIYTMRKKTYQIIKSFWRLGLFKNDIPFKKTLEWIRKLWIECNCDWITFMNRVWNRKPQSFNNLKEGYEQPEKNLSLGENQKCPSSSNSLSSLLDEYGTGWVSPKDRKKMEEVLKGCLRNACQDLKWYAIEQGRKIRNMGAFFKDRLRASAEMRRCC